MSSYNEIQADRHAHEMGQIDRIERQIEKAWDRDRDDLVAALAMGEVLRKRDETRLLDFDSVISRMGIKHGEAMDACFKLAATHPDLAGHHMKALVETVAGELVDLFADDLMGDLEDAA